jgi:type VI secretion system protein ImpA
MTPVSVPERATDWLQPVSALEPCGPSLEYDHDYAVLRSRMAPRADAQYGTFVGAPEAPHWAEIERDCRRLLLRTRDINLLVWLCRARTRLGQAAGLADGLALLRDLLHAWPDAVHPQRLIDGEPEPALRANALAGLADPEGLLADVCEIPVASSTVLRLTVRDVERAFAMPRPPDAPGPEAVARQLAALRAASRGREPSPMTFLARAAAHVRAIDAWARAQLGDDAPSLHALGRVLDPFDEPPATAVVEPALPHDPAVSAAAVATPSASPAPIADTLAPNGRDDALAHIRRTREWFERHEPSSPVAVLLKQAERLVGKRFPQIADSIPLDLLRRWDATPDGEEGRP